jgi:DNA-binding NtrC family response regulator
MNATRAFHLGKRRERALVLTNGSHVRQAASELLTSFGYRVDEVDSRRKAVGEFLAQRHEIIVIDACFLPRSPKRMRRLFQLAHREPLMFIAAPQQSVHAMLRYLGADPTFNLLHLPFDPDDFAFTFARALHYRREKTNYQFHRDALFLLVGGLPVFVLMAVLIALHVK